MRLPVAAGGRGPARRQRPWPSILEQAAHAAAVINGTLVAVHNLNPKPESTTRSPGPPPPTTARSRRPRRLQRIRTSQNKAAGGGEIARRCGLAEEHRRRSGGSSVPIRRARSGARRRRLFRAPVLSVLVSRPAGAPGRVVAAPQGEGISRRRTRSSSLPGHRATLSSTAASSSPYGAAPTSSLALTSKASRSSCTSRLAGLIDADFTLDRGAASS